MSLVGEQVLLRAYLQSADRAPLTPTFERLVTAARREGLAGATVLRGIMGFGSRGPIGYKPWSLVEHVPVIVEIVDSAAKIGGFLSGPLDQIMSRGMFTLERAGVILYRPGTAAGLKLNGPVPPLSTLPQPQTGDPMKINEAGVLLRVFIGESDKFERAPLYEAILRKARELGLAGGTVLRGTEGFGANSVVHKAKLLEMSTDLPIVIEIVDTPQKIQLLLPHLETMVREGMITMEHVRVILYRHAVGA